MPNSEKPPTPADAIAMMERQGKPRQSDEGSPQKNARERVQLDDGSWMERSAWERARLAGQGIGRSWQWRSVMLAALLSGAAVFVGPHSEMALGAAIAFLAMGEMILIREAIERSGQEQVSGSPMPNARAEDRAIEWARLACDLGACGRHDEAGKAWRRSETWLRQPGEVA